MNTDSAHHLDASVGTDTSNQRPYSIAAACFSETSSETSNALPGSSKPPALLSLVGSSMQAVLIDKGSDGQTNSASKLSAAHWIAESEHKQAVVDHNSPNAKHQPATKAASSQAAMPGIGEAAATKWDVLADVFKRRRNEIRSLLDRVLVGLRIEQKTQLDDALIAMRNSPEAAKMRIVLQSARLCSAMGKMSTVDHSRAQIKAQLAKIEFKIKSQSGTVDYQSGFAADAMLEELQFQAFQCRQDLESYDARQIEYKTGMSVLRQFSQHPEYMLEVAGLLLQKAAALEVKHQDINALLAWIASDAALYRAPNILQRVVRCANALAGQTAGELRR